MPFDPFAFHNALVMIVEQYKVSLSFLNQKVAEEQSARVAAEQRATAAEARVAALEASIVDKAA